MSKRKKQQLHFDVRLIPPRENKMFTPWMHAITRFMHFTRPVKCAYCGRMGKHKWTSLKFFKVLGGQIAPKIRQRFTRH